MGAAFRWKVSAIDEMPVDPRPPKASGVIEHYMVERSS